MISLKRPLQSFTFLQTVQNIDRFKIAAFITFALGAVLVSLSFYLGKIPLFLHLNGNLGKVADQFFRYFTYAGDGFFWLLAIVVFMAKKRRHLLPLIVAACVISTVLTQVCKQVVVPSDPRPSLAITQKSLVHYVQGVQIHSINSFPSGHTATAFCFLLLVALLAKRQTIVYLSFVAAVLVGYSRIYLAQHFPLDVGAGMIIAVCSVSIAILVQQGFEKRRNIMGRNGGY